MPPQSNTRSADEKVHDLTNEETHMRDLYCTGRRAVLATVLVTNVW